MKKQRKKNSTNKGFDFIFDPDLCWKCKGKCCICEKRSYLWVTEKEIKALSEYLSIKSEDFKKQYLYSLDGKWSVKDLKINNGYQCVFWEAETGKCAVYPVRPKQCSSYPFWDRFKKHPEEVFLECIAVKKG